MTCGLWQVKHDIMVQPNEYEIVDYVWDTFRVLIGKSSAKHFGRLKTTTTNEKDENLNTRQGPERDVTELPDKMNKFVYIYIYLYRCTI